jgi:two-component system response regulator AtoC
MSNAHYAVSATTSLAVSGEEGSTHARSIDVGLPDLVVADPAMQRLYALIDRLAPVDLPVLIIGETGCGKELIATALHARSPRAKRTRFALNCAALNAELVESELFGHAKGAFSGAIADRTGLIEAASGSTLFLDEVGELPLAIQAKLLRVLESHRVTRVGEVQERKVEIRIVSATNRDLEAGIDAGTFRRDLYFRLSAALIHVPPLRHRPAELPILARCFLDQAVLAMNRSPMSLSPAALSVLQDYSWPGNIRELRHVMQYVAATQSGTEILAEHIVERLTTLNEIRPVTGADDDVYVGSSRSTRGFRSLAVEIRELEMTRIQEALSAAGGNQTRAAALLGMPLRTLYCKVRRHGISPQNHRLQR